MGNIYLSFWIVTVILIRASRARLQQSTSAIPLMLHHLLSSRQLILWNLTVSTQIGEIIIMYLGGGAWFHKVFSWYAWLFSPTLPRKRLMIYRWDGWGSVLLKLSASCQKTSFLLDEMRVRQPWRYRKHDKVYSTSVTRAVLCLLSKQWKCISCSFRQNHYWTLTIVWRGDIVRYGWPMMVRLRNIEK